jgi:UDP-3-O-[3-hydroxymyristoyl] glucosamine N-acyltransferase
MEKTLREIADLLDGEVAGDPQTRITGVAGVDEAASGDLVFAETARFLEMARQSKAAAVLTSPELAGAETNGKPLLLVTDPRLAFVRLLETLDSSRHTPPPGVHPTAQIGEGTCIGNDVHIGAQVTVGANTTLGDRVTLLPGVSIGENCWIGDDTILHPNVVLYPRVTIGSRCILHAGCVLGADGFGYILVGGTLKKVPQLGTVEIGDDVEIGANTCIDRAKTGKTVIGSGTKIDNLVQIGHNVRVGRTCILVSQVGVAGSVTLGDGVVLAGQVGIKDHVTLGDGAKVGAKSGVISDVPANTTVLGNPALPYRVAWKGFAALKELPELIRRLRGLEKRLVALEEQTERGEET